MSRKRGGKKNSHFMRCGACCFLRVICVLRAIFFSGIPAAAAMAPRHSSSFNGGVVNFFKHRYFSQNCITYFLYLRSTISFFFLHSLFKFLMHSISLWRLKTKLFISLSYVCFNISSAQISTPLASTRDKKLIKFSICQLGKRNDLFFLSLKRCTIHQTSSRGDIMTLAIIQHLKNEVC